MVKVASVYKDLICELPAGLCKDIDVQEYATAQDMMESTCIKVGYAHTLGFYEVGDGGAAYYTVGGEGEPNGMDVLECRKGLVAELVNGGTLSSKQIGGSSSQIINRLISIAQTCIIESFDSKIEGFEISGEFKNVILSDGNTITSPIVISGSSLTVNLGKNYYTAPVAVQVTANGTSIRRSKISGTLIGNRNNGIVFSDDGSNYITYCSCDLNLYYFNNGVSGKIRGSVLKCCIEQCTSPINIKGDNNILIITGQAMPSSNTVFTEITGSLNTIIQEVYDINSANNQKVSVKDNGSFNTVIANYGIIDNKYNSCKIVRPPLQSTEFWSPFLNEITQSSNVTVQSTMDGFNDSLFKNTTNTAYNLPGEGTVTITVTGRREVAGLLLVSYDGQYTYEKVELYINGIINSTIYCDSAITWLRTPSLIDNTIPEYKFVCYFNNTRHIRMKVYG